VRSPKKPSQQEDLEEEKIRLYLEGKDGSSGTHYVSELDSGTKKVGYSYFFFCG
jgi:hypothetical protein